MPAARIPTSRLTAVKRHIKRHFVSDGEALRRDGRIVDPKYPPSSKRPRSIAIGKFGGKPVIWTVAQVRMLLHLGDLPANTKVMYLDGDCQNDALDNLRLIRRSPDRKPRRTLRPVRAFTEWGDETKVLALPALPKNVTSWNVRPRRKGTSTDSGPRVYPRCAAWIRIDDNELLLGLYDAPWDAQKAVQAAREAAWLAVLSPNDRERMAALADLIRKRRTSSVLKAIANEVKRLDAPPSPEFREPNLSEPRPIGDTLIHDAWHKPRRTAESG